LPEPIETVTPLLGFDARKPLRVVFIAGANRRAPPVQGCSTRNNAGSPDLLLRLWRA
jgi:hypothetical protein